MICMCNRTVCGSGSPEMKVGLSCHVYAANKSMDNKAFANADADMLVGKPSPSPDLGFAAILSPISRDCVSVPELGSLLIKTECGILHVRPGEICVLQRGIRFSVSVEGNVRGYIAEIMDGHFQLPELGPIGANGLANTRDFLHPTAYFEHGDDSAGEWDVVHKFAGKFFSAKQSFSPFNVVAWHGNYSPYKYDLDRFCAMNSVTFDHPVRQCHHLGAGAGDGDGVRLYVGSFDFHCVNSADCCTWCRCH